MTLPKIMTVVTQKGGAGKTTLALSLGVHWYQKHQAPVAFIDADPQRSLEQALAGGPLAHLLFAAESREGAILDAIGRARADKAPVIIDTKGDVNGTTLEAVQMSDLMLVPLAPSRLDWNAATVTLKQARVIAERRAANPSRPPLRVLVVINHAKPGTHQLATIKSAVTEQQLNLADTVIHSRVAFSEALEYGEAVSLFEPKGNAAAEIAALAGEIEALMQTTSTEVIGS